MFKWPNFNNERAYWVTFHIQNSLQLLWKAIFCNVAQLLFFHRCLFSRIVDYITQSETNKKELLEKSITHKFC